MQYQSAHNDNMFGPARSRDFHEGESHDQCVSTFPPTQKTDRIHGGSGGLICRIGCCEVYICARVPPVVQRQSHDTYSWARAGLP